MDIANNTATAMLQALAAIIDSGSGAGYLQIYGGAPPANVNSTLTIQNPLLAQLPLAKPCATVQTGVPSGQTTAVSRLVFNPITPDYSANANGIPNFYRITDSALNPIVQGLLSSLDGSSVISLDNDAIFLGGKVTVTNLSIEL